MNLKQGNISVADYSLKFSIYCRYAPSLVCNLREETSSSVTGVAELVKEECRTSILHDDMTLSTLMVYAQSIEESKIVRIRINLNTSGQGY